MVEPTLSELQGHIAWMVAFMLICCTLAWADLWCEIHDLKREIQELKAAIKEKQ